MISSLEGKIQLKTEKYAIIEVGGIGFKALFPRKILQSLPQIGQNVKIYTYLAVRESSWDLFGFLRHEELEFFELLISISGIGPKTAMNILSAASAEDLEEAIVLGDEAVLGRVSGLGKKNAQRIILELKTKVKKIARSERSRVADDIEAIDALVSLGYRVSEARTALDRLPADVVGVENRVKEALKRLGKK